MGGDRKHSIFRIHNKLSYCKIEPLKMGEITMKYQLLFCFLNESYFPNDYEST